MQGAEVPRAQGSLSDFWRYDRSGDRAVELVSILQGADLLVGNMGSDIRVAWAGGGVSYTDLDRRIVALDYGPLSFQECPFPGAAVDEVIGYAAHEGGHCLWSLPGKDRTIMQEIATRWSVLPEALKEDWQAAPEQVLIELCRIQNVLEDAYIDHQVGARWPVLGEYTRVARRRLLERVAVDRGERGRETHPDRSAIINIWVSVSLHGCALPATVPAPVRRRIDALLCFTLKARVEDSAQSRQQMAVDAAALLWKSFPTGRWLSPPAASSPEQADGLQPDVPSGHETQGGRTLPNGDGAGSLNDFDPSVVPGGGGREVVPVPVGLLQEVASAAARDTEDLSQSVALALAEDPRAVVAKARKGQYDPEHAGRVVLEVQQEIGEVRRAFLLHQDVRSRWRHGVYEGRLDDRRLWKTRVGDPGCYKRRGVFEGRSLAVGLLLDVSGSMTRYMSIVEQTAAVFSQGLQRMQGVDFTAWFYDGKMASVVLSRICDRHLPRLCLSGVSHGGQTPSGAAIAGVKLLMDRMQGNKKMLIHFTDGRPDSKAHVEQALQACRGAGIQVYAIGLPQHSKMLSNQYGAGNFEVIQGVEALPQAVASILKKLAVLHA